MPLFNPDKLSFILGAWMRANVAVGADQTTGLFGATAGIPFRTTVRKPSWIIGVMLVVSPDGAGNLASTWTADIRVNDVKVAQVSDTFADTLVFRTAVAEFGEGVHGVAVGDTIDALLSASGDVNANSDASIVCLAVER